MLVNELEFILSVKIGEISGNFLLIEQFSPQIKLTSTDVI